MEQGSHSTSVTGQNKCTCLQKGSAFL